MTTKTVAPPPEHLGDAGRKLWQDVLADYAITDAGGLQLLARAAECVDRIRAAQGAIAAHGEVVTDRYGAPKLNPACSLEKDARNGFLAAIKALGIAQPPEGTP